jgi:hypothetical protein
MNVDIRESTSYLAWTAHIDDEQVGVIIEAPDGGYTLLGTGQTHATLADAAEAIIKSRVATDS